MNLEDINDEEKTSFTDLCDELNRLVDTVGISYDLGNKKAHMIINRLKKWYEDRY